MEASEGRKTKTENVEFGDIVEIEYVGKLRDETIVAQAKEDDPLRFKVGAEEVIKGLDIAVIGMEIGQVKEVEIQPQDAYGGYNPKKVKKISKGSKERDLVEGAVIDVKLKDGRKLLATVIEVASSHVLLDFNHPLAGKTLFFTVKLLDIK